MEKNIAIGWLSLILFVISLVSMVGAIFLSVVMNIVLSGNPVIMLLTTIGFYYVFNKTIRKKKKLTNGEWIAFIILIALIVFSTVLIMI